MRRTLQIVPGPERNFFFFFFTQLKAKHVETGQKSTWGRKAKNTKRRVPLRNYKNVGRGVYPPCLCVRKQANKVPYKDSVIVSPLF